MSVKGRVITEQEVSQTIDLDKYLGRVARVEEIKEAFTQAVIDKILERTASSRDVNGKLFPAYSQSYKDSLAFKVFNKSGTVNMALTGDMMGSLDKLDEDGTQVTIGLTGETNILKAFGHITGYTGKTRDFFGVTEKELQEISSTLKPDLNTKKSQSEEKLTAKILNLLSSDDEEQDES